MSAARFNEAPLHAIARLKSRLDPVERGPRVRIRRPDLLAAAVLAPLVERDGVLHLILTERARTLARHAGQIAFPGGRVDADDASPAHAALREAHEEIGLPPERVELLGCFDAHETGTGYEIIPFVGLVRGGFEPRPDPAEVADVFETPFPFLMDPANHRRASREWRGRTRWFYEMPYEERYIWGATAGILKTLSDRLYGEATCFG